MDFRIKQSVSIAVYEEYAKLKLMLKLKESEQEETLDNVLRGWKGEAANQFKKDYTQFIKEDYTIAYENVSKMKELLNDIIYETDRLLKISESFEESLKSDFYVNYTSPSLIVNENRNGGVVSLNYQKVPVIKDMCENISCEAESIENEISNIMEACIDIIDGYPQSELHAASRKLQRLREYAEVLNKYYKEICSLYDRKETELMINEFKIATFPLYAIPKVKEFMDICLDTYGGDIDDAISGVGGLGNESIEKSFEFISLISGRNSIVKEFDEAIREEANDAILSQIGSCVVGEIDGEPFIIERGILDPQINARLDLWLTEGFDSLLKAQAPENEQDKIQKDINGVIQYIEEYTSTEEFYHSIMANDETITYDEIDECVNLLLYGSESGKDLQEIKPEVLIGVMKEIKVEDKSCLNYLRGDN